MNRRFTFHRSPLASLLLPFTLTMLLPLLASCHKTCRCYGYDGAEYEYTSDQVDEQMGGNCSTMIYQGDSRYYSICEWI